MPVHAHVAQPVVLIPGLIDGGGPADIDQRRQGRGECQAPDLLPAPAQQDIDPDPEDEEARGLRPLGQREQGDDEGAGDPARRADAALLLAVPPDIEGGEGEAGHDGIRLGDGEFLQQQRAEQKASRGEERGAQAGIAARQPLDQQRRQQHREHDRPAGRPFVHPARQGRDEDGGPGQQDGLLGPALAIDLRLQPMAALDDVLRHGRVAALLIDEGARREIGERGRGPDGDHQQQYQEPLAPSLGAAGLAQAAS